MKTDVYLIRHGESFGNVEGRLCGNPPGPGLTERGRSQAQAVARHLLARGVRPAIIASSPLLRVIETAAPLLLVTGRRLVLADPLREVRFGAWEGLRQEDVPDSGHLRAWYLDPERFPPPGGERLSAVAARVVGELGRLSLRQPGGAIVAFSHMHPLVALTLVARGQPFVDHGMYYLPNAAIVHVRFEDGHAEFISIDPQATALEDDAVSV